MEKATTLGDAFTPVRQQRLVQLQARGVPDPDEMWQALDRVTVALAIFALGTMVFLAVDQYGRAKGWW